MGRKRKEIQELSGNKMPTKEIKVYETYEECEADRIKLAEEFLNKTDFSTLHGNPAVYVDNKLCKPLEYFVYGKSHGRFLSAEDLQNCFDLLLRISDNVNKVVRFDPTIASYCRMLGITMYTFNQYTYQKNPLGETALMIQDYFKGSLAQGMTNGFIHPAAGSYLGKAMLGMKEQDGQNININVIGGEMSLDDILAEYEKNKNKC